MIRYRMYLGQRDRDNALVSKEIQSEFMLHAERTLKNFTVYPAIGVFSGKPEGTLVLEYLGDPLERSKIEALANDYVKVANQDSVLVTHDYVSEENVSYIRRETVQEVS